MSATSPASSPRPRDVERIDLANAAMVDAWTRSLSITPQQLKSAVDEVGSEVGRLYDYIQRSRQLRA